MEQNKDIIYDSAESYGGCQYRLSYDNQKRRREKKTNTTVNIIITVLVITLFLGIGSVIYSYYKDSVKKIFNEKRSDASYQSSEDGYTSVNIIIN